MSGAARRDPLAAAEGAEAALVVSRTPGEVRVARLDHGAVTGVLHHRSWAAGPGAVLLGRLGRRAPDGRAWFVDLGPWGDGILDAREMTGAPLPEGTALLVQVRQTARVESHGGTKAARLTRAVALTSRRLALGGRRPGVAASKRFADTTEKARLLHVARACVATGESLVVRAGAAGVDPDTLMADLARLRGAWEDLMARVESASPPALLSPAPVDWGVVLGPRDSAPALAVLDDTSARSALEADLAMWSDDPPPIIPWSGADDLFEAAGVAEALDAALDPVVPLPGGGRLVIEPTAALVAADVDAGAGDARAANAQALAALPGELRLRGLAGSILMDLIPGGPRLTTADRAALEAALAADPWPARLAGISRLGLLEVSRERRGPTLADTVSGPAGRALAALRDADRAARATPPPIALMIHVDPEAAALLRGPLAAALRDLSARRAVRLSVREAAPGLDGAPRVAPP
ncbi:hypothetical protein F1188_06265 [Roseospira marina]|uniref:RNA-binding protein AU-1/Ribonuclease E/G domain-containing protein n=1 Tax=Roseospira marina TaxID=140057 RepID=A0A5M6IDW3_9PROT|nr:ribonuclease E/G [Roseospira marina]KAA5606466.1 hypothetical protein F1188_06265 [Roseospira marina]MBB4314115.1 ribonuclease E/ribonuclease G [Roseospira marina]MBB5087276.1 ribonuclease E/ribonuclease G [Roseospira marina]